MDLTLEIDSKKTNNKHNKNQYMIQQKYGPRKSTRTGYLLIQNQKANRSGNQVFLNYGVNKTGSIIHVFNHYKVKENMGCANVHLSF